MTQDKTKLREMLEETEKEYAEYTATPLQIIHHRSGWLTFALCMLFIPVGMIIGAVITFLVFFNDTGMEELNGEKIRNLEAEVETDRKRNTEKIEDLEENDKHFNSQLDQRWWYKPLE